MTTGSSLQNAPKQSDAHAKRTAKRRAQFIETRRAQARGTPMPTIPPPARHPESRCCLCGLPCRHHYCHAHSWAAGT